MKLLSFAIVVSSLVIGGVIYYTSFEAQKSVDKENIFKITESGNLVRFNKKTLRMTICGLSDRKYRCLHFDDRSPE